LDTTLAIPIEFELSLVAFGRSIFAHKIAKISKGSGADFLATQLYSAGMLASGL